MPDMAKIELTFERLEHDVADYGSDDLTVGSRAFFSTRRDGVLEGNFHADLSYPADADPQTAQIEVGAPEGYRKALPQQAFAGEAAAWAQSLIASAGLKGKPRQPRALLRRHAVQIKTED
jgi:hypothetical protein